MTSALRAAIRDQRSMAAADTSGRAAKQAARLREFALTIEIPGLDALGRLLSRISQLPNIIEARRHRAS